MNRYKPINSVELIGMQVCLMANNIYLSTLGLPSHLLAREHMQKTKGAKYFRVHVTGFRFWLPLNFGITGGPPGSARLYFHYSGDVWRRER